MTQFTNSIISSLSINEVFYKWIDTKRPKLKTSTIQKYISTYNKHITHQIGCYLTDAISSDTVNKYLISTYSKANISASLFNLIRYLVKATINYGVQMQYITNITILVEAAHRKNTNIMILSTSQQKELIKCLTSDEITSVKLGILIALHTGMRLGEICGLQRNNIDFENGIIHVTKTVQRIKKDENTTALITDIPKSLSSFRDIPLTNFLMNYLNKYNINNLSEDTYILSKSHKPFEPRTLQYGLARFINQIGINNFHFHCLRHTFATNCIRAGMDPKTLSELLGHSNISITLNLYVHSDFEQKKKQIELFEERYFQDIS